MTRRVEDWLASDRATRVLAIVTLVFVTIMMTLAGLTIPGIASNTEASRRTDDLASCRAAFDATTDAARDVVSDAQGEIISALALAVVHAIQQNAVALDEIGRRLTENEAALEAAKADLRAASAVESEALLLSQEDPDLFLDECEAIQ